MLEENIPRQRQVLKTWVKYIIMDGAMALSTLGVRQPEVGFVYLQ